MVEDYEQLFGQYVRRRYKEASMPGSCWNQDPHWYEYNSVREPGFPLGVLQGYTNTYGVHPVFPGAA